jgi:glucosyl-3-phosphoglycerate phosphatase
MSGRVRLVLVRHGESVWNVEERYQGQADSGLTAAGLEQAEVAAGRLLARFGTPDLVVSSDLPRARDTANAYLRHLDLDDLDAKLDARLREADIGTWAGRPFTEIAEEHPDDLAAVARGVDVRRGGGETFAELRRRVWEALVDVGDTAAGGATVVVFTHGGPIRVAAAAALCLPSPGHLSFAPPVNASLTVIGYGGGQQNNSVVEYNSPTARAADAARTD